MKMRKNQASTLMDLYFNRKTNKETDFHYIHLHIRLHSLSIIFLEGVKGIL